MLAIGLVSVLFALAAGGALAGLAALESLLDHHVPVAYSHPQPLLPGPRR